MREWLARWWQWWRCCRKSGVYYITYGYKQCVKCGTIYWRD